MMVSVTGANGFVGRWLVPRLLADGHDVLAGVGPQGPSAEWPGVSEVMELDLGDSASVVRFAGHAADWVIHLAGFSSRAETVEQVGTVYETNVAGTARLADALGRRVEAGHKVRMLHVSTGLVYGHTEEPAAEDAPVQPRGAYAVSKAASEVTALDAMRRRGLEVVIARPFGHTGRGQTEDFVLPTFVRRVAEARTTGAATVDVGNLESVRDYLHVSEVVDAYVRLMDRGRAGHVYNVASGVALTIRELFGAVVEAMGVRVAPEVASRLVRTGEATRSVGDAQKLKNETGWHPTLTLAEIVQEVVDAQAN